MVSLLNGEWVKQNQEKVSISEKCKPEGFKAKARVPDPRRKEQKFIKVMLGVLSHQATDMGPSFLLGFDLNAPIRHENCQAQGVRTCMELLIDRYSILEQEIYTKEILDITKLSVKVDVENGVRGFGDAEKDARAIIKREKLKEAGRA